MSQTFASDEVIGTVKSLGSVAITALRYATKLQEYLERNSRAGARVVEQTLARFGIKQSDASLQRAQYLGGNRLPIQISEVLNTNGDGSQPLGDYAGHGIGASGSKPIKFFAEERGYIMSCVSVLPQSTYFQGIPRLFGEHKDRYSIFVPEFEHIGEQEIKNKELFFTNEFGMDSNDGEMPDIVTGESTFGYAPRYAEYKSAQDSVHGDFRNSLVDFHTGRIFTETPQLNYNFVQVSNSDVSRVFNVTDDSNMQVYLQHFNDTTALRPMSQYSTPYF